MLVAVVPGPGRECWVRDLAGAGAGSAPAIRYPDLTEVVSARERAGGVRWVWADTSAIYPVLLRAGVRVERCHDIALTEALLLSRDGRGGDPATLAGAWARSRGTAVPRAPAEAPRATAGQQSLFEPPDPLFPGPAAVMEALVAVHHGQARRIAADEHPERFALLAAAESASALAAGDMAFHGLPWRADIHDRLLTGLLGPRPVPGLRPARMAELADGIRDAFGGRPVNPDSPAQVMKALAADGVRISSTRSHVLREVGHPAVPLLLQYKELARLHSAHGWAWLSEWVAAGRFRPEYVVGGVVSGRWATRGGGALQIPRVLRRAVVADPGWVLVVADAAQLEPRVLAALSGDGALAAAAGTGDLYESLAGAFGGDRGKAKVALLSAMYGGAGGEAGQLLAVLRRRFPLAARYVEDAARAGREGRIVRSRLGRTCPPPSQRWRHLTAEADDPDVGESRAGRLLRARGRFTRNFVVQASAADWAAVLLAVLRRELAAIDAADRQAVRRALPDVPWPGAAVAYGDARPGPHLVFFQHDEVIVHCPAEYGEAVAAAIGDAARDAGRLVFGETPVCFPVTTSVVTCYADAA